MIKHYCEKCGKEITDLMDDLFELEEEDFLFSTYKESQMHFGKELCRDCYYKRLSMHTKMDLDFFGIEEVDDAK